MKSTVIEPGVVPNELASVAASAARETVTAPGQGSLQDVEGIISVAYLGEVENLTVGHVQVGLGKTGHRHR